jgi:hypothetical protein
LNGNRIEPGEAGLTLSGQSGNAAFINNGELVVGENQPYGRLTIHGETTDKKGKTVYGKADVVFINPVSKSIKEKLGVDPTKTGAEAVTEAFSKLSAFIEKGGLTNPKTQDVIQLGDYIVLEGGLFVEPYPGDDGNGGGKIEYGPDDPAWTGELTFMRYNDNNCYTMGYKNRLIVVGINSFKDNESYKYPKGSSEPDPPDHVVFQFDNVPVERRMNPEGSTGGYPASELRKYLTKVDSGNGGGNFLAGLTNAGVPEEVLWAPRRVISTIGATETINDLLWLPTEREMLGFSSAAIDETESNQARLAYYVPVMDYQTGGPPAATVETMQLYWKATKNVSQGDNPTEYWLASAEDDIYNRFCLIGGPVVPPAVRSQHLVKGVAPAFCVYGLPKTRQ